MNRLMSKKILVVLLSFLVILASIISMGHVHIVNCHNDDCAICAMIHFSNQVISIFYRVIILLITLMLISYYLSRLHETIKSICVKSLIYQKVQFNE